MVVAPSHCDGPGERHMPIKAARWAMVSMLCVLVAGCAATVTHQRETKDGAGTGIRYYESAPYLIIYSDGKGGLKWQIRYLPDQSKVLMASPSIVGGRTEMTLYFQNGVLSSAMTAGDTTELPKAVIAAVQSALPLILGARALDAQTERPGFPAPYLYKIVVAGDTVTFIGNQGDTKIQVPIDEGASK
jgi:hypothetical protein